MFLDLWLFRLSDCWSQGKIVYFLLLSYFLCLHSIGPIAEMINKQFFLNILDLIKILSSRAAVSRTTKVPLLSVEMRNPPGQVLK